MRTRGRLAVAVTLSLAAVMGCDGDDKTPQASGSATGQRMTTTSTTPSLTPQPPPSPTLPPIPSDVKGYEDICDQDQDRYRSPRKYTGVGPHPVVLFPNNHYYVSDMPQEWFTQDPRAVALVVCKTTRATTQKLGECTYKNLDQEGTSRTVPMYATLHTLTVREPHTNTVVTTIELTMDAYDCPRLTSSTSQSVTNTGSLPTSWVIDALRPVITATRPAG